MNKGRQKRFLASVMFTDIVGSTDLAVELGDRRWRELLGRHHTIMRRELKRFGGREIDTAGDGFFVTFDAPESAIRCACEAGDQMKDLGIEIRAGIHVGQCEQMGAKVGGIAVHTAARVLAMAGPAEVWVSGTTKELVGGSGINFEDRGTHSLKGVPGEWHLYSISEMDDRVRPGPLDEGDARARRDAIEIKSFGPRRRVLLLGGVVAIVAGLIGAFFLLRSPAPIVPGPDSVSAIDTSTHEFFSTTPVGNDPIGVAVGEGSVWVVNDGDSTITRVVGSDPPTASAPQAIGGRPTGVAAGEGSAWITTGFGTAAGDPSLVEYTLASDRTHTVQELPSGAGAIAVGDGFLWVADRVDGTVIPVNPKTFFRGHPIEVGEQPVAISISSGPDPTVWVANKLTKNVSRIQHERGPSTPFDLNAIPTAIAADAHGVWVTTEDDEVIHLDLSGTRVKTIPVPAGPISVAIADDGVWVACSTSKTVVRIDPGTNEVVETLAVSGSPTSIAAESGGNVWVAIAQTSSR
jgi:class 3 adenylate cyclase/streptogramin lyase